MERLIWMALFVLVGALVSGPISESAVFLHIVSGRWILENASVPYFDVFNQLENGQAWITGSWGFDCLLALLDRLGTFKYAGFLKSFSGILLSLSAAFYLGRASRNWFFGAILSILMMFGLSGVFSLSPWALSWAWFICLMGLARDVSKDGVMRIFGPVTVILLWANTAPGALWGAGAWFLWGLNSEDISHYGLLKGALSFAGLAMVSFFTPYLIDSWSIGAGLAGWSEKTLQLRDFGRASGVFVMLLGLIMAIYGVTKKADRSGKAAVLVLSFIASLFSTRIIPFTLIVSAFYLADMVSRVEGDLDKLGNIGTGLLKLRKGYEWISGQGFAFVLIVLSVLCLQRVSSRPVNWEDTAASAYAYVKKKNLAMPLISTPQDGDFIMYKSADLHGRVEPPVLSDSRFNFDLLRVLGQQPQAGVVPEGSDLWKYLKNNRGWCRVFTARPKKGIPRVVMVSPHYLEQRKEDLNSAECAF